MSDDHQKPASDPVPYERPGTLGEKIPALWALIGLILSFIAVAVSPRILKHWEPTPPTEPPEEVLQATSTGAKAAIEQDLRSRLKAKADTQRRQLAKE
jgi:hypothetical protein